MTNPTISVPVELLERLVARKSGESIDDEYAARAELRALLASQPAEQPDFGEAYQGAREDLAIWKRRALEAETALRRLDGETHMGEPLILDTVEVSRTAIQRLFRAAGLTGAVPNDDVLNAAAARLAEQPSAAQVPEGYTLVPLKPTAAMRLVGARDCSALIQPDQAEEVWKAMLGAVLVPAEYAFAAAPKAPEGGDTAGRA